MTITEFQHLDVKKQCEIVFDKGKHTAIRKYYGQTVNLYSVYDFFVEVFYSSHENRITKVEAVTDEKIIDRYIDSELNK